MLIMIHDFIAESTAIVCKTFRPRSYTQTVCMQKFLHLLTNILFNMTIQQSLLKQLRYDYDVDAVTLCGITGRVNFQN